MRVYIPFNEEYLKLTTATPIEVSDYSFKIKGKEYGIPKWGQLSMADCVWLPTLDTDKFLFPQGLVMEMLLPIKKVNFMFHDSIPGNMPYGRSGKTVNIYIPNQKIDGVIWNRGSFKVDRKIFSEIDFELVEKP